MMRDGRGVVPAGFRPGVAPRLGEGVFLVGDSSFSACVLVGDESGVDASRA